MEGFHISRVIFNCHLYDNEVLEIIYHLLTSGSSPEKKIIPC